MKDVLPELFGNTLKSFASQAALGSASRFALVVDDLDDFGSTELASRVTPATPAGLF